MSESSDSGDILTPEELRNEVSDAELSFLPSKSADKYIKAYELFNEWKVKKRAKSYSETVLLTYFMELAKNKKPPTLSMSVIKLRNDCNIGTYPKLLSFLKSKNAGYRPKKSKVLSANEVEKFLKDAPDQNYLHTKVALVLGVSGTCHSAELFRLKLSDLKNHSETLMLVQLDDTKTNIDRSFVVRDHYVKIVESYIAACPANASTDKLFMQYRNGKCINLPMGIHSFGGIPKLVATYLKLENPELYTGHCFRRTSATLLAEAGVDLTTIARHGGWKNSNVAEGYIEGSVKNKAKICQSIFELQPSTSKDSHPPPSSNDEHQETLSNTQINSSKMCKVR